MRGKDKAITIRKPISRGKSILLGVSIWLLFFVGWHFVVATGIANPLLAPPPGKVLTTLYALLVDGKFIQDIGISVLRVVASFLGASLVAIPLGILMGTFATAESFLNPFVSAWRYLPAPALFQSC